jgi:3-hydroxymyristoyl/3-hydroxydecanoyl-(acyl carrier protein) dehydratase
MNPVQKEILKSIISIKAESDSELRVQISFTDKFIGFDGHFDERPVLPAICLLEIIKCSLYKQFSIMPVILEVIAAKFYNVIGVKEKIDVIITAKANSLDINNLAEDYLLNVKFIGMAGKKALLKVKTKSC